MSPPVTYGVEVDPKALDELARIVRNREQYLRAIGYLRRRHDREDVFQRACEETAIEIQRGLRASDVERVFLRRLHCRARDRVRQIARENRKFEPLDEV